MLPPKSSTLFNLLMLFFFLCFLSPNVASDKPSSLIKKVCAPNKGATDPKFCIQVLQSEPKIASANNSFDMALAIMESGKSNATNAQKYMQDKLKKEPKVEPHLEAALNGCNSSYHYIISAFKYASHELKDKHYDDASYQLFITMDYVNLCIDSLVSEKITDPFISLANKFAKVFVVGAFGLVP